MPTGGPSQSITSPDLARRYDGLLAVLQDGILVQDAELKVVEANPAAELIFGAAEGSLLGTMDPVRQAVDEDYRHFEPERTPAALALASGMPHSGNVVGVQPPGGGALRWFSVNTLPLTSPGAGGPDMVVSSFTDVTERRALEVELTHLALHDGLTGVANRTLLVDRIGHAMARTSRRNPDPTVGVSALFIDIDALKAINDNLGNRVGDEILRILAQRLTSAVREEDTVARVGGDEFVVLCEEMNRTDLARFCVRVTQIFSQPVICRVGDDWRSVGIGCTAGVAMARTGEDADRFLQRVDKMLKEQSSSTAADRAPGVSARPPGQRAASEGQRRHHRR
ncbi:MAG TPA: diguanylate cyclase [Acidimicrobiales bacterium]|nr:diguanylate cyclase [Acidimicrobiales bacterium]